ncbi:Ig-like domain-containing protein [Kangiella marina]|uniref:Cadherin domain-containing protein n=1 Tax=Kangiella marina TaxID=1079178 RepID=A0ABP8ICS3_9GAMM
MKKILATLACALSFISTDSRALDGTLVDLESSYGMGPFYDVAYHNNTAYAVDSNEDLIILDVTDSSNVVLIDELAVGCGSTDLDIDGNTLVVRCAFEVHFFDVSDSSAPTLIGTFDSSGYAVNSVKLVGNRMYMIGGNSDIAVFNASDLTNLQNINTQTFGSLGNVSEAKIDGNYLYTVSRFKKVRAFDLTDENLITELTLAEAEGTLYYDASIVGDTLYIGAAGGLRVYDISDVNNPSFVSTVNTGSSFEDIEVLKSLHVIGDKLFAGKFNGWIFQFDISTPNSPTFQDDIRAGTHEIYGFTNSADALYVAYGVDGLRTLDISSEAVPYMDPLGSYGQSMIPEDLDMSDGRVLVSDETGLFHIIDIDAEYSFIPKSRIPLVAGVNTQAAEIKNNIGWLGVEKNLDTYDFSTLDPSSFLDSKTPSADGFITYLKERDNTLYVGASDGTIVVYDVSTNVPSLVSSITLPPASSGAKHYIKEITPYGDYVLASSVNAELLAVDFSDTANPSVVSVPTMSEVTSAKLFVTGDVAISASDFGVFLIDISDLTAANHIGQLSGFGLVTAATEIDSDTILLSSTNGLLAVDISDSANISIISQLEAVPELSSLAFDGSDIVGAVQFENELRAYQFNLSPTAASADFTLDEDTSIDESVSATDPEGDDITFGIVTEPSNGTVTISANGLFTYEPALNFNGQDSFTFSAKDVHGGKAEATVTLTVNVVNDAPVANPVNLSTGTETEVSGDFEASDPDGDELTYNHTNPENGSLTVSGSSFVYTPNEGFSGEDTFEYTAMDASGAESTATVTIAVINNAPVANLVTISTSVDTAVSGTFSTTDSDGDELTIENSNPSSGSLTVSGTSFTYTPNAGFSGSDSFQYTVTDPYGASATASVRITVNAPSSGGGSNDWWLLSLLFAILVTRLRLK